MAHGLTKGKFWHNGQWNTYRCECDDGTILYSESNDPSPCSYCPNDEGISTQGGATSSGFRNMSGGGFSMKNLLIYGAIGFGAFMVYKKFIKK